ncbi:MAG: alpha/beta fold hydrolase [Acidobacteria bacterium]|nr:alpha/beta fold hydrolase [Acidobacteriota bacterium]
MPPVLYLHGFASGPTSSKGVFFQQRFAARGVEVDLPDLTSGDFEHLTLTGQLEVIDRCVSERRPAVIIGSSLGGYLAALYAARHPGVFRALVLLAPGFGFARRWPESLGGEEVGRWRERGWREVYHYGLKRSCRLSSQLLEDGLRYEDYPDVQDPTLVIHGARDDVVDPGFSREFARTRPNVTLHLLDSDHQLLDVLDRIWELVEVFLTSQGA